MTTADRIEADAATIATLTRELEEARADAASVRELMNVYNLGGWTDAVAPMKRALAAETQLAERTREKNDYKRMTEAAYDAMRTEPRDLLARAESAERQVAALREALADAISCVEHWSDYANEYFQKKHDLAGDIARLRVALAAQEEGG